MNRVSATLSRAAALGLGAALLLLPIGCKKGRMTAEPAARPPASDAARTTNANALPEAKSLDTFDAFSALGYRPEWVGYPVIPGRRKINHFDAYPDIVLVQESGNLLTAMDAATGANRWTFDPGSKLAKFVGNVRREDGEILCSSESEVVILDPATGAAKNRQHLASIVNTKPALVGNVLVFGCPTGVALAHSLGSGYRLWEYALDGTITAPPVQVGSSVAVVSQRGELVILNPRDGKAAGRGQLFGGLATRPVSADSTVYFAGLDQSIWAFDEMGRSPKWRVRLDQPLREQPVVIADRLYVAVPDEGLACFDAATGRRLWTTKGLRGSVVALRAGRLIHWDGKHAYAIDPAAGDVTERIALPGIDRLVSDNPIDGNMYAYSLKGEVRKFSPKK